MWCEPGAGQAVRLRVGHRPVSGRCALFWVVALFIGLVLAGCSSVPPVVRASSAVQRTDIGALLSPALASDVTLYAIGLVGTPYRYGGNTPQSGFDCSGLIGHVYQTRAGLKPPRTVSMLKDWGQPVGVDDLRSGDLAVFFQSNEATHAGIYVGEGRFVHAPSNGGKVRLDALLSKYWASQRVEFRRP